jgi:hypothetical protein
MPPGQPPYWQPPAARPRLNLSSDSGDGIDEKFSVADGSLRNLHGRPSKEPCGWDNRQLPVVARVSDNKPDMSEREPTAPFFSHASPRSFVREGAPSRCLLGEAR